MSSGTVAANENGREGGQLRAREAKVLSSRGGKGVGLDSLFANGLMEVISPGKLRVGICRAVSIFVQNKDRVSFGSRRRREGREGERETNPSPCPLI